MRRLCWLVLLAGCASLGTPYQHEGLRGGYTDNRLDDSTYVVDVFVNGMTSRATALAYFARRSAELCKASGYAGFVVLEERANETDQQGHEHYGRVRCR